MRRSWIARFWREKELSTRRISDGMTAEITSSSLLRSLYEHDSPSRAMNEIHQTHVPNDDLLYTSRLT